MDRARIVAHDAPYDPWPQAMTVNEEIRAIQRNKLQEQFVTSRSDGPQGCRHGWQATKLEREDKFLAIGARGRSPAQAATQWQPISPIGLTACKAGISQPSRAGVHHKRRQPFNNRLMLMATQTATVINRINPTPCFSDVAEPRQAPMGLP